MYSIDQEHLTIVHIKPEFKYIYESHPNWNVDHHCNPSEFMLFPSYNLIDDDLDKMEQWILNKYNVDTHHVECIETGA